MVVVAGSGVAGSTPRTAGQQQQAGGTPREGSRGGDSKGGRGREGQEGALSFWDAAGEGALPRSTLPGLGFDYHWFWF